jgi:hypothetical protein
MEHDLKDQQKAPYPIQGLLVLGILILLLISYVRSNELEAIPLAQALTINRDTVYGHATPSGSIYYDLTDNNPWLDENKIVVRNTSNRTIQLDSVRFPLVSLQSQIPLYVGFEARSHSSTAKPHVFTMSQNSPQVIGGWPALSIPPRDSIELGMFGIGDMAFVAKVSASPNGLKYGDSVTVSLVFFGPQDSIRFTVKSKVSRHKWGVGIKAQNTQPRIKDSRSHLQTRFTLNGRRPPSQRGFALRQDYPGP